MSPLIPPFFFVTIYMSSSCELKVLSSFSRCTLDVIYKDFANCALCLNPYTIWLLNIRMVQLIDAQNSSSKEGVQVFPIGTWVPLNHCGVGIWFCTNSCRVSKGYMYVFQLEVNFFQIPTLASYPPKTGFQKPKSRQIFKFQIPGKASSFIV